MLLNCEAELLAIAEQVEIAYFLEATRAVSRGPYDVSLVEGSITTAHDAERIKRIRQTSKCLVAIGACATAGGIQALRNTQDIREFVTQVYATPEYIETLATSTPIAEHVLVDVELRGCPISKAQLLDLLVSLLRGRKPNIVPDSVCAECKRRGTVCVMVAGGVPCLGPVTHAGCGAICPHYGRGCYGCFGPKEMPNARSLSAQFARLGMSQEAVSRMYQTFNAHAEAFRTEAQAHGGRP